MIVKVAGCVDGDQVLSLRFGDSLPQEMPKRIENILCDIFANGEMAIRLIGAFGRDSNTPIDFELTGICSDQSNDFTLIEVRADDWILDTRAVAQQLLVKAL